MPLETTAAEGTTYRDRATGVTVRQLTDHLAHSYHLYFTNPGWWDDGRRLLFGSDRGNASNLYSLELATGAVTRLTDNSPRDAKQGYQNAYVNPARAEAYCWRGTTLRAIDLRTGAQRTLYTAADGWGGGSESCTADGRYVVTALKQQVDVGPVDLGAGYVGFRELFEAHPLCRVVRIPVDGPAGHAETLHEERSWIGHVNASPTRPNLLTFCHEGPWHLVDHRIWGMDTDTGKVWKIRPQQGGEAVGHEYWMADGVTVGYHGHVHGGDKPAFYGFARYDDTDRREFAFPLDSNHFHSNTPDLIVADGPAKGLTPYVLLCRFDGERFDGPRVLCTHRGSRHIQHLHVHPRFTPDGRQVLYTADPRGYGNLYLADVPEFESLPTLDEVTARQRR